MSILDLVVGILVPWNLPLMLPPESTLGVTSFVAEDEADAERGEGGGRLNCDGNVSYDPDPEPEPEPDTESVEELGCRCGIGRNLGGCLRGRTELAAGVADDKDGE